MDFNVYGISWFACRKDQECRMVAGFNDIAEVNKVNIFR